MTYSKEGMSIWNGKGVSMIALIVAFSKNRVIGNKGMIPWKIKGEQKRFKELTTGNVVIMGRRSYEEIGKPLPNRTTIVVSNTKKFESMNCTTATSLNEALKMAEGKNVYISGGAGLYKESIDLVDKMYITLIDKEIEGDTFFPLFDEDDFDIQVNEQFEGEISYSYMTYTRKKITLCGDNCLACPRYMARSDEELEKVAELWYRVGWRDKIVSNAEIRCGGCASHKQCIYGLVDCTHKHGANKCNQCFEYPCDKIKDMLGRLEQYKTVCREKCTNEEFNTLSKAFFEKEINLKR